VSACSQDRKVKKTKKQRDPEQTRDQLVRAASRLIHTRGLARVTTREIAREAGCAEGTLYKHFESKDDLFLAVLLESLPTFETALDLTGNNATSIAENLRQIVMAAIRFFEKVLPQGVALLADSTLLGRHRKHLRAKDTGPRHLYDAVAKYIAAEQNLGRINRTIDPLGAASLMLGPCFQWVLTRMINGNTPLKLTDEQFADQLVSTLLEGLAPRP
jgi:AcrR family transcriptional regulator